MFAPAHRFRAQILILALALITLPFTAGAKEESKIQIRLTDLSGNGNGNGNGLGRGAVRADVHTQLQGTKVVLKLRARGLDADTEYVLLCKDDEAAADSAELTRFTSKSNGSANVTQNLAKTDDPEAPADPRGKYLVIANAADETNEIAGGWLYGAPQDDGPKTKIKEVTELAPDADASPSGTVAARYDMRPNGHGKLSISMRRVPAEDYEILVDGVLAATLTPNPAGNARADFQTRPIRGNGSGKVKPHHKKQQLGFDPRRKEILVQLTDGTAMFNGPMLAQIEGLNTCSPSSSETPLTANGAGSGVAALEIEENCETAFDVEIRDVAVGSYDLFVNGVFVATFDTADDGSGTVWGFVRFDPTPDAGEDEWPLDFPVGSGSLVEVMNTGDDPGAGGTPVLYGNLL
ncbi:MAG: hypothetical protein JRF15_11585 [Deltaproteobacteria bacterium]|jgi:hypothetical protein|nr:hypothetical protein [Deltaproteobacteria bacterium]